MYIGTFLQDPDFIRSLYIIAFSLFIIDLRLMNHPRTARRGNVLGAIGMAIIRGVDEAAVAQILDRHQLEWDATARRISTTDAPKE